MDQAVSPIGPETNNQAISQSEQSQRRFMSEAAKRAARLGLTGAIAIGTVAGVKSDQSARPEVRADVPYQQYGTNGNPAPVAEFFPKKGSKIVEDLKLSNGVVEGIKLVPTDNPYEIAQQLLWLFGHNKMVNRYWNGVLMLPAGTALYHAPVNSDLMPANPSNNGEADKFVVPEGNVLVIQRLRMIVSTNNEPNWAVVTLDDDKATQNRATDITQEYWLNLDQVLENSEAKYFAYRGSAAAIIDGVVDANGNPIIDNVNVPLSETAVISIIPKSDLNRLQSQLNLEPTEARPIY